MGRICVSLRVLRKAHPRHDLWTIVRVPAVRQGLDIMWCPKRSCDEAQCLIARPTFLHDDRRHLY
jgi:hypothetical protein